MNVFKILVIVAATLSFTSCQSDLLQESDFSPIQQSQYVNVDERLWTHFETFEKEASLRGITINLNSTETTGEISSIPEDGVAGTCQYNNHFNHVTIDANFWNNASPNTREFVVFHELGHCVLHRDHEESSFENGICRSIMRSGLENCRDAYVQQNRSYYIDELFMNSDNIQSNTDVIL